MKNRISIFLTLMCAAAFFGCEDVILLDLNESESKIVIEGNFEGPGRVSFFRISRSSNFYDNEFEPVSGASVLVGDSIVKIYARETRPGYYEFRYPGPHPGRKYEAIVTIDGVVYTAQSIAPPLIRIDSLTAVSREPTGLFGDTLFGKTITIHFRDQPGVENFAQITNIARGFVEANSGYLYLYDGKYSDGRQIDYSMQYTVIKSSSTNAVMIRAMDESLFEYFRELKEVIAYEDLNGNGIRDVAPTNPNSNWSNGALGYFGAFQLFSDTITIVIP